ncbi:hypothetical protein FRC08_002222 [Ceratobasidium sp. 394]|nr:hypothetical protein FRC08_002222 [Ceratobasidium sp. 394]
MRALSGSEPQHPGLTGLIRMCEQNPVATTGYQLVPTLRPDFSANDTVPRWMRSPYLPPLFRRAIPPCQPKDLGRGDTIYLTPSLFGYKILSTWRYTAPHYVVPDDDTRIEYRGGSFSKCITYGAGFDYSWVDDTFSVTVGVDCCGTPVNLLMETTVTFANDFTKDNIGKYYGYNIELFENVDITSQNYRRIALAVLDVLSADARAIMGGQFLSSPVLSLNTHHNESTGFYHTFVKFMNGSCIFTKDSLGPAAIYHDTIYNLVAATVNAVQLDLKNAGPSNFLLNRSAAENILVPNLAPKPIKPSTWISNPQSWYYGAIVPPYQTWAQMLLAGHPENITLGNLTGLPEDSKVLTNYLCPSYQLKPKASLLASIFVGTAAMCISVWAMWKFITTIIAQKLQKPCFECTCGKPHHFKNEVVNASGLAAVFAIPLEGRKLRARSTSASLSS